MNKTVLTKKATGKARTKSALKTKKNKTTKQKPVEPIQNNAQSFIKIAPVLFIASLLLGLAAVSGTHYRQATKTTQPDAGNNHVVLAASHLTPTNDNAATTNDSSNVVSQAATFNASIPSTQASPPVAQQSPQPIQPTSSLPTSTQPTDSATTPVPRQTPSPDPLPSPPVQIPDHPAPIIKSDNLLNDVGNLVQATLQHVLTI